MIDSTKSKRPFSAGPINVGAQQLAGVYARALLDAALTHGQTEAVLVEFDSFIDDVLDRNPRLETVLSSAMIGADDKNALLDKVFGGRASPLFLNFLKVLGRHGRLDILRPIGQAAHALDDERRGIVRVQVAAAVPLDDALQQELTDSVRKMLGGVPVLAAEVRPELVGGMMMRVGDTVYDGSISTRLERIRQLMIDRSVHEIQSRRDRFGFTAGN